MPSPHGSKSVWILGWGTLGLIPSLAPSPCLLCALSTSSSLSIKSAPAPRTPNTEGNIKEPCWLAHPIMCLGISPAKLTLFHDSPLAFLFQVSVMTIPLLKPCPVVNRLCTIKVTAPQQECLFTATLVCMYTHPDCEARGGPAPHKANLFSMLWCHSLSRTLLFTFTSSISHSAWLLLPNLQTNWIYPIH